MPQILFNATAEQKELWVEAAHGEKMSLSKWIRTRLDRSLAEREQGSIVEVVSGAPDSDAPRSESDRTFRPDFKGKR